ncbi:TrkA family potassium uptake protein [uncultured Thomasclavelia sp.]|uniref:potassium channel family protein n=1 Tax=uncultured Thomasclavelia sp. TaxID=3025759 RepID=UPI0025D7F463|nr:TrkA family potassium uptake protein [uncultured Thomasclavelia sp.]
MKSVLIIGLGRFGRHLSRKFIEEGNAVLAIEKDEERADNAVNIVNDIQIGDATNEDFIESLGVNNFDICIVAIGDNFQTALEITVLLKDCGAKYVIARANRDVHRKLLLRNGADYVVYAEKEIAEKIAVKYGSKNVFDYLELTPDIGIYEIKTPESWLNKTIIEKKVRTRFQISILATKKDGMIYPLPQPDHVFSSKETLIVMAKEKSIKEIARF